MNRKLTKEGEGPGRNPADRKTAIAPFSSPADLLHYVGDCLREQEVENNLVLGICGDIADGRFADGPRPLLLALQEHGHALGAAVMTPPHNLLVTRMTRSSICAIIEYLVDAQVSLPGVAGPAPDVAEFAERWSQRTGRKRFLQFDQRLYACERVIPPSPAAGRFRTAEPRDAAMLELWIPSFCEEAGIDPPTKPLHDVVAEGIGRKRFFVWEHGAPVTMAACSRDTGRCIAVNCVYTPAPDRGHGYATSCVAALTERLLASGKRFCCLYTDLANPTSNSIYQRIGYRPVCDAQVWRFAR